MFLAKIYGAAQEKLFHELHELYEKGLSCLLQCLAYTSRSCIIDVLSYPSLSICTDESVMRWEGYIDEELF